MNVVHTLVESELLILLLQVPSPMHADILEIAHPTPDPLPDIKVNVSN